MASVTREKNGRRTIQFVGPDSKRRSIRLGKVSQRMAEAVKVKVEHLAAAAVTGHALDSETARWVAELGDDLAGKLSRVGLIPERESAALQGFLDSYVNSRADVKESAATIYGHTRRCLVDYLGPRSLCVKSRKGTRTVGGCG